MVDTDADTETRIIRMAQTPKLISDAVRTGCSTYQLELFLRAGYIPVLKQLMFHTAARLCDESDGPTEIGFGGARGPGKSHAMFAQLALDDCQRFPNLKVLILRKILKAGKQSFDDLRAKILRQVPHHYNATTGEIVFPNGSRMVLGHFKDDRSFEAQIGLEYDAVGIEEATTLEPGKYQMIRTCCRTSKRGWRPRIYSNANPGGVGHTWYKRKFIDPYRAGTELGTRFIPATCDDNPFLNADYITEVLDDLMGWQKKAWRYGDWDVLAGQYFSNFDVKIHVIEPFQLLHDIYRFILALDYGWQHPTVALLVGVSNEGDLFVLGEYGASKRLPEWHSREIRSMLATVGVQQEWLYEVLIGADAFQRGSDGRCVADDYKSLGWQMESALMARIDGATEILRRLGDVGVRPSLYIFNTCPHLIEQLAAMQHDPLRPEDVMKVNADEEGLGGDDYYDALRYAAMAIRIPPVEIGPSVQWQRR